MKNKFTKNEIIIYHTDNNKFVAKILKIDKEVPTLATIRLYHLSGNITDTTINLDNCSKFNNT